MISKKRLVRATGWVLACGALLLGATDGLAAQAKKKPPTKKPTTQMPVVTPTASEGSTAIAARGRPVSSAAGRAVNGALKTSLANANVRNAVRAEVLRQLRVRRPFAVVNGYLVSAIDLAPVYQTAGVRPALLAALGVNGPQLINQARVSADRLTLVFTPATFGQIVMPKFTADLTATLGVNAVKNHMTDFVVGPVLMIVVLAGSGTITIISLAESLAAFLDWLFREDPDPTSPDRDYDGDGLTNAEDPDDDNDNVPDSEDNYPYDKDRSICDCGRPRAAISLTSGAAGDFLPSLVSVLNATQAQRAKAVSLGAVAQGQSAVLGLIF